VVLPDIKNLRIVRFNIRGAPHHSKLSLSGKELLQAGIFLLIMILLFLMAMYVGWWTLQQEENEAEHQHQHARVEWKIEHSPRAQLSGVE
jgi:hypothetical protein